MVGLKSVEETVNLANLELGNYIKKPRECLSVQRSVDTDLIERVREKTIPWEEKYCVPSLYDKLRKWGIKIGGNG